MKTLLLRRERLLIIDDCDYERVSKLTWTWTNIDGKEYVYNQKETQGKKTHTYIHRFITGAKKGQYVDHINGNPLDNRRENLRLCTNAQNGWNRSKTRLNTSGYKGVTYHKFSSLWHAVINVDNKVISLGYHHTPIEAAKAYDRAAKKYHGEYAYLNFRGDMTE